MKDDMERCQSCGMTLLDGNYGTNKDLSPNLDYCHFCFEKGGFTSPDLTLEKQIEKLSEMAVKKFSSSKEDTLQLEKQFFQL